MIGSHVSGGPLDIDIVNSLSGLLMLGLAVGVVGMIVLVATTSRPEGVVGLSDALGGPAAMCLFGASLLHLAAVPHHFEEYLPFGVAFVSLAGVQAALGLAYARGARTGAIDAVALVVNIVTLVVWVWSRTTGLPLGPLANQPEGIGGPDLAASVFELAVVGAAANRLGRSQRYAAISREAATVGRAFTLSAVGLITVLAIAGAGAPS